MAQYVNREYSSNTDDDGMDAFRVDLDIRKLQVSGCSGRLRSKETLKPTQSVVRMTRSIEF